MFTCMYVYVLILLEVIALKKYEVLLQQYDGTHIAWVVTCAV